MGSSKKDTIRWKAEADGLPSAAVARGVVPPPPRERRGARNAQHTERVG